MNMFCYGLGFELLFLVMIGILNYYFSSIFMKKNLTMMPNYISIRKNSYLPNQPVELLEEIDI